MNNDNNILVTNKTFLKQIAKKKLIAAFDISGGIPDNIRKQYVPTMMMSTTKNCKIKSKPIMLTFDHEVHQMPTTIFNERGELHVSGVGGTDIERLMTFIVAMNDAPDVVLYITDGQVCWHDKNIMPNIKQYVQFTYPDFIQPPKWISIIS